MVISKFKSKMDKLEEFVADIPEHADQLAFSIKDIEETCTDIEKLSTRDRYLYPFILFKGFVDSFSLNKKLAIFFGTKFLEQAKETFKDQATPDQAELIEKVQTAQKWFYLKGDRNTARHDHGSNNHYFGRRTRLSTKKKANSFFKTLNKNIKKNPGKYFNLINELEFGETEKGNLTPEAQLIQSYVVGIGEKADFAAEGFKLNTTDIFEKRTVDHHYLLAKSFQSNICLKKEKKDMTFNELLFCKHVGTTLNALSNLTR